MDKHPILRKQQLNHMTPPSFRTGKGLIALFRIFVTYLVLLLVSGLFTSEYLITGRSLR